MVGTYQPDSVRRSRARCSSLIGSAIHGQPLIFVFKHNWGIKKRTSVERRHLSIVGLPEVLALIQRPLGG